jgi:hypothetical protein
MPWKRETHWVLETRWMDESLDHLTADPHLLAGDDERGTRMEETMKKKEGFGKATSSRGCRSARWGV